MKGLLSVLVVQCLIVSGLVFGQDTKVQLEKKAMRLSEAKRYQAMMRREVSETASEGRIDVTYYLLDVRITSTPQYIRGKVQMNAAITQNNVASLTLDLMSSLHIDSVLIGATSVAYTQHAANFDITLDRTYNSGESIEATIYYQGTPGVSGFGSFEFTTHGSGTPWIWSLSEPYGAKDWWPCKDHPSDKADSADIVVTCDQPLSVGSEGKLISVENHGDSTTTYHWQERYPISTYLVSVAISNYAHFSNWFKYSPTDSMEVLNYVLPEHLASARSGLSLAPTMLSIYSSLFGLYPFINEKYGHSEFGWGGGMEHQTMTSLVGFDEYLVVHEMAHQWFGDMITCRTWPNIWLNEGFATYCEALYAERNHGTASYWSQINGDMSSAKYAVGSVYVTDTSDVNHIFDGSLVYDKGASVLHMLRHVIGDSAFFHAMYNYAHAPGIRFGTATTEDFEALCEAASGMDLHYFFNEWIYGQNYPRYTYSCGWGTGVTGNTTVTVTIHQTTGTTNPAFFTMPVDFKVLGSGWDTTVTVWNNAADQTFSFDVSHTPTTFQLDPQGWILKSAQSMAFAVNVDTLKFGAVPVEQSAAQTITVNNYGLTQLFISSATADSSAFSVSPTFALINAGASATFTVTFSPVHAGTISGHLIFVNTSTGSPNKVAVTGTAEATTTLFYTTADSLDFGPVQAGATKTDTLAVWNTGSIPLMITSATSDSAGFTVTPSSDTIPPSDHALFFISFSPNSARTYSGAVTFVHNGTSSPSIIKTGGSCNNWNTILQVQAYWNLVSLPYTVPDPRFNVVFPTAISNPFRFHSDSGYVVDGTLSEGTGYWLKFNAAQDIGISGILRSSDTIEVKEGWNLIGSISSSVNVHTIITEPPDIIVSNFFCYNVGYFVVDVMQSARGYWVKVSQDGLLFLTSGSVRRAAGGR